MRWGLIIEDFGSNIQHIYVFDNIVDNTLSKFPSKPVYKYEPSTVKAQCLVNKSFTLGRYKNNEYCFRITLLNVQREQQKETRNRDSILSAYLPYRGYGYAKQVLYSVE